MSSWLLQTPVDHPTRPIYFSHPLVLGIDRLLNHCKLTEIWGQNNWMSEFFWRVAPRKYLLGHSCLNLTVCSKCYNWDPNPRPLILDLSLTPLDRAHWNVFEYSYPSWFFLRSSRIIQGDIWNMLINDLILSFRPMSSFHLRSGWAEFIAIDSQSVAYEECQSFSSSSSSSVSLLHAGQFKEDKNKCASSMQTVINDIWYTI